MKRIWKLAAWHWALARKPFLALCAVFAAQQLALLLAAAALQANIGHSYATLYAACWQPLAFLLGLAAALLVASAGLWRPGAARTGTALLTLPGPRWHLAAAQSALCALLALIFTAWQVVLYAACYVPVTALLAATAGAQLATPYTVYYAQMAAASTQPGMPATTLYAQAALQPLFQALAPAFPLGWAALAVGFACVAVQSGCLFFHRGWGRAASAALWLCTCGGALLAVYGARQLHQYGFDLYGGALVVGLGAMAVPLAVQLPWTLLRLRRGELL